MLTGGTDVHLVLVDLTPTGLDGKTAEDRLEEVGITVNRNAIPFDERPPMNPSGLRIGTPALTTRGLVEDDMREIAEVIATALGADFESEKEDLRARTRALMDRYPLYSEHRGDRLAAMKHLGRHERPGPRARAAADHRAAARRRATRSRSPRATTRRRRRCSTCTGCRTRRSAATAAPRGCARPTGSARRAPG